MENSQKQIPQKLLDSQYMKEFFKNNHSTIDGRIKEIAKFNIWPIKKKVDEKFFHLVILYAITFFLGDGSRKRFKIFCASYINHKRKKMYELLKLAYENGFKSGSILVPRPLYYKEDLEAVFYVGVPGDNLLEHIKNGAEVSGAVKKAANFLANWHEIKPPTEIKLLKHEFNYDFLDPTKILEREKNKNHQYSQKIKQLFKKISDYWEKTNNKNFKLSHGDFHPENIIINHFNSKQIVIIDFSEGCLAPKAYDLGSFLQQLKFMTLAYDRQGKLFSKLEKIFLNEYFKISGIDYNDEIKKQILLYQAWTALKSAVYYMIYDDQYEQVEILIKQVQDFIQNLYEEK